MVLEAYVQVTESYPQHLFVVLVLPASPFCFDVTCFSFCLHKKNNVNKLGLGRGLQIISINTMVKDVRLNYTHSACLADLYFIYFYATTWEKQTSC